MAEHRASGRDASARADQDEPGHRTRRQRLDAVLDLVIDEGYVSVEELTERLRVSPATVRRDLDVLASQQLLIRSHGGASAHASASALPLRYRATHQAAAKDAIARAAVALIPPGGVIGMNGGTTTTTLAHELAASEAPGASERPTVLVTNALNIAQELAVRQHLQLVVTGGVVRGGSFELVGTWAEQLLDQIHIDLLFLGADAVGVDGGARTHDEAEAAMSARLAARASRVVLVADSSKLGQDAFARICPIDAIHTLITDDGARPSCLASIREAGVEVLVADKEPDT